MPLLDISMLCSEVLLGGFSLQNISLQQNCGEKIALVGETGSGKSTLLKIIAGFIQAASGSMVFEGKVMLGPNFQLIAGQEGIAYLSQHFELRHNYKIKDLLALRNKMTRSECAELFAVCKVDHLLMRTSRELSGGERQRIALACLLVQKPRLLILDEPFTNLDAIHKSELKHVIEAATNTFNTSVLLASHDAADVLPWADTVLVMQQGIIVQHESAKAVYETPASDYAAGLLGVYNKLLPSTAAALGFTPADIEVYIRPHSIEITNSGILAKVTGCRYFGTHYEIDLEYEGEHILVHYDRELVIHEEVRLQARKLGGTALGL
jgi:ABC-type sulfate/molybdate transport systems ATPase subunit